LEQKDPVMLLRIRRLVRSLIRSPRSALVMLAVGNVPLCGQTIWNVAPPGSNLLGAIATAQHGDTIVMASGFYNVLSGIATDKGLTIVGVPGAVIYGAGGGPALHVQNLGPSRTFTMRGVELMISSYVGSYAFLFDNNAGAIHLAKCRFRNTCSAYSCSPILSIMSCPLVTISECQTDNVEVDLIGSNVAIAHCSFLGHEARAHPLSTPGRAATCAILVFTGVVTMAQCSAAGGDGDGIYGGVAGLAMIGGSVAIAGDANDVYSAGVQGVTSTIPASAIHVLGGSLLLAPQVTLLPHATQPGVLGSHATSPRPLSVATRAAAPGGTATVTVIAEPGDSLFLFAGLPAAPWALPPFGDAWLLVGSGLALATQLMGPTEHWTHALPIPNVPVLSSLALTVQALGGGVSGPLRTSLPGAFVIE
jgi:hypothetical protein